MGVCLPGANNVMSRTHLKKVTRQEPSGMVAHQLDLLVDVTIRHDFIGAGRSGFTQGQLRNLPTPPVVCVRAANVHARAYAHGHVCARARA